VHDRLSQLVDELLVVEAKLGDPNATKDRGLFAKTARRHAELSDLVKAGQNWEAALTDLSEAKEILHESTGIDREDMRELVAMAEVDLAQTEDQFRTLLLPKDPNDGKNVIVEIRGAEGGEEANLFARDLFEMFRAYGAQHGWKIEVLAADASSLGGYSDVSMVVRGTDAWRRLKHEGGPHRVQRVPATESQGRIHTSSATVTVLPEADEVEVNINPNDLEIDYFRASGPGGQSVNTTDSAVRITHKPTGTVVSMQDEKSQLQNREKALRVLRARILRKQQDDQAAEMSAARRDQVGGGGRSEKIRTYNFKENRVTDHRIGLTLYKLDKVLAGDLDDVVDALLANERQQQLLADGGV